MTDPHATETATLPPPEHIAPLRIPLLLFPFVALLVPWFPRLAGPHVARAPWWQAFVVALLSFPLAAGVVRAFEGQPARADLTRPLDLLARSLIGLHQLVSEVGPFGPWTAVLGVGIALLPPLGLLLLSVAVWPLISVGERRGLLAARSAKLALWSAPTVLWFVLLGPKLPSVIVQSPVLLLLMVAWYLSILVRLGQVYSGPAEGIRWEPYELQCETCGYPLVTLADDARCPECGRAVADSRGAARRAPRFGQSWMLGRVVGFFLTLFEVRSKQFGAKCSAWQARRASRWFLFLCCVLSGIVMGLLLEAFLVIRPLDGPGREVQRLVDRLTFGLLSGLVLWLTIAALQWVAYLFNPARALRQNVVLNYLSGNFLVNIVSGATFFALANYWIVSNGPWPWYDLPGAGRYYSEVLLQLLAFAPLVAAVLLSFTNAWRQAQFAGRANT